MGPSDTDQRQPPVHFFVEDDSSVHVHVESKPSAKAVSVSTKNVRQKNNVPKRKHTKTTNKQHTSSSMDSLLLESVLTEMKRFNATNQKPSPTSGPLPAIRNDITSSPELDMAGTANDQLLSRLIDFEQESVSVARAVDHMSELTKRMSEMGVRTRNISQKDIALLRNTSMSLYEQLEAFDVNNRVLRSLLRQREEEVRDKVHLQQQKESLLFRHAELEAMNKRFQTEILEKEKHLHDIQAFVDAQRDENLAIQSSHDVSESTRIHLHKQLRVKESDCNRMAVQIRQLETQMAQDRIDSEHLMALLQENRSKAEKDKVSLKRAARAQKERANRLAEEVDRLHSILVDKEPLLEQLVKEEEDREKQHVEVNGDGDKSEEEPITKEMASPDHSPSLKDSVGEEERKSYECLIQQHQQECKRAEQRLHNYELRLRNAEERNKTSQNYSKLIQQWSLANQLGEASSVVDSCRKEIQESDTSRQANECRWREAEARLEEVRRERDILQLQLEAALTDVRRQRESLGESVTESRLRQRVKVLENEQRDLKEKMERIEGDKVAMEKFYCQRLAALKEQLDLNISKDKTMRLYVQHIKDSYAKCFGDGKDFL